MKYNLLLIDLILAELMVQNDFAKLMSYDKSYINITSFKFFKKSRTVAALNVTYITLEDINTDEDMRIKVNALQFRGNEYKKTVVDFNVGICTLYKANKFSATNLIKDSNLHSCPFAKGLYYIYNLSPTADLLPPFFPEGKWMLDLQFTHLEKTITRVHWMLTVTKKV